MMWLTPHQGKGRNFLTGDVLRSMNRTKVKTFSRFRVRNLRIGQHAAERARSTQVEGALTTRGIPQTFSYSRTLHSPCFKPEDRPHVPSISYQIRQFLRDSSIESD